MESLKAKNVARKVLPFLTKKELPVTPNNYRIWFEYFMGENEEIKTHLDELLESDTKFTPELNDQLYEKFFVRDFEKESSERTLKEIDVAEDTSAKASDLIMSTIKDLLESSEITSEYGQKLKSYTQDVGMAQKIEDVKNLLTSMVRDTHEAEHTNVKIQKKLKNSSVELKKINLDLTVARKEARTDKLTGLYNRRMFDELLKNHIELMENEKKDCSIIMLDIDFFKKFNDLYGHPVGDKLLKAVSEEIVEKVSDNGLICRYGGEEFIVLCPDI
ncbi:MAG: GGDEF domain-containing protein, partial [Nitrospinota bacterium]